MKLNECLQSRSQAVGMWQVLVDEDILIHVKQELNFHDKDTQFYRFMDKEFDLNPTTNEKDSKEDELQECLSLLSQMGPDALLTMILRKMPSQRTAEDLEVIYEELLHIKAVAHLSTSVRKELASVLVFESHPKAGTVLFSQGDKGTSWYIIWKGSVNVITHGKGLVTTLHEGEDFGQLALVNDAPRSATIILREDNCHFLRVDKQDFIRILKDVEANTVRLEEHGKVVLVLEKSSDQDMTNQGGTGSSSKYTVMSGTPEKILEHLLETIKLDISGSDCSDPSVSDFLLTHQVFMPSSLLCTALLQQYPYNPSEGSELEKVAYALNTKQKVVKLVVQWVALYGLLLKDDPVVTEFLEVNMLKSFDCAGDATSEVTECYCHDNPGPVLTNDIIRQCVSIDRPFISVPPLSAVLYEIFRPDHTFVSLLLPVNLSVEDVISAMVNPGGGHILVKMNSSGGKRHRSILAGCPSTIISYKCKNGGGLCGVVCCLHPLQTPLREQLGPEQNTINTLEQICSKDIASQLTSYDWELFTAMHEVELVRYIFGRHKFPGTTTANLERFVRRFNEVQYWVVTELCLCADLVKRAALLKKFIKMATVLKEQKNLNSFFAVMFGLSNSAVQRLQRTWEKVPNKIKRIYCVYERLMDPSRNHRAYRLTVAKLNTPYIPFMPLLLKDVTFTHEGNKTYTDSLVNFEKMRMIAKTVKVVKECRSQSLTQRSTSNIRHYIQNLKVIDNQRKLTQLSRDIER
uniref:Rap guanine nucleotide exchange factor (GEF) 3 n=1 Tax=Denticeps clupeoides TaxID=299321 RepID=A0AAY4CIC7_9TELE